MIERDTRSATAIAHSDCELVTIDRRRFWFLVQETPYFAEIVMRVMVTASAAKRRAPNDLAHCVRDIPRSDVDVALEFRRGSVQQREGERW